MDEIFESDASKVSALMNAVETGGAVPVHVFARLTGTPENIVARLWKNGVLPCAPGQAIPMREGVVALVSVPRAGRKPRSACPNFLREADALARVLLGLAPRAPEGAVDEKKPVDAIPDETRDEVRKWKLKFLQVQTAAKSAAAEKLKLENDIKKGVYVKASDVELDAATTASNVASALSRLPIRAAGMCVGHDAEGIAKILKSEVDAIIHEIQRSAFTGEW